MRIAFDLDNTLIRGDFDFPLEEPKKYFFSKISSYEPLREGTHEIFKYCQNKNWETWVYTSSYRSTFYIRKLFWLYNIHLHGVVNQYIHDKYVKVRSTKYPPTFNIDLLVDDSEGVKIEGERFGFKTLWIKPEDYDWQKRIKNQLFR